MSGRMRANGDHRNFQRYRGWTDLLAIPNEEGRAGRTHNEVSNGDENPAPADNHAHSLPTNPPAESSAYNEHNATNEEILKKITASDEKFAKMMKDAQRLMMNSPLCSEGRD
uniref:NAM-associated domain-containing protein n=2 Tax=Caenorhabditis tropicalis TaxID=1561998 RepID=A0A1I7TAL9_9PELO